MDTIEATRFSESDLDSEKQLIESESSKADFLDVFLVLAQAWRTILIATIVLLFVGIAAAFILRPDFTAYATILPPQQQQSVASAMVGQLGSLAAMSGAGSGAGASLFKNPAELYVGILASRTIADYLVEKYNLKSVYHKSTTQEARRVLKSHTTLEAAKNGLIMITVVDHDSHRASDLANGYVDELYHLNSTLAISEAAQRRVFFDQELAEEKNALANAENDLKSIQEKTGLIQLSGQAEIIIRTIAQLRAEIASREVQIESLRLSTTDQNPEMMKAQQEINSLREQLSALESSQKNLQPGDTSMPAGRVPQASLEYIRKLREVRYHETLYELLTKQYEAARIDEAKSAPLIQVIDRAVPPEKKSGPTRSLLILGGAVLGFIIGCVWVLVRHGYRRLSQIPANATRLHEIRQALRPLFP
jgi:uncharacterized protein involved in exopolysaccharide biosynthesis